MRHDGHTDDVAVTVADAAGALAPCFAINTPNQTVHLISCMEERQKDGSSQQCAERFYLDIIYIIMMIIPGHMRPYLPK